jgi:hypothetical protein
MGTRHLTVVYDTAGELKIAQYGQWDGYPSATGCEILDFLRDTNTVFMLKTYRLKECSFLTDKDFETMSDPRLYPQLNRDLGSDILHLASSVSGLKLRNSIDFAADSLFCEWAYVIDFSTNNLEVYRGFSTEPAKGRFADLPIMPGSEYQPVTLVATYPLDNLPSNKDFLAELEPQEEDA